MSGYAAFRWGRSGSWARTRSLRLARNARDLLEAAQRSLGHPVEIISGLEEARLIYLGVSRSLAGDERRLAVDIGGGSTELIIGEGSQPLDLESLYMGCVSSSLRYFPNGRVKEKSWRRAETAALVELEPVERRFRFGAGWESAVGSSGTVLAPGGDAPCRGEVPAHRGGGGSGFGRGFANGRCRFLMRR